MQEHEHGEFGPFVAVAVRGRSGLNPLKDPNLRVIMGSPYIQGTFAWPTDYWLNGHTALIPLDQVCGIFTFSSEQEYVLAAEKHRAREKEKKTVEEKPESTG